MNEQVVASSLSDARKFEFMEIFNQVVVFDQSFAERLPQSEFELAFDGSGNIYVDGRPFGANVLSLHQSLAVR
ncbi:MAG: hypothetical protein HYW07_22310 [Candidatus Latescibacteria bacterium]|nr:hypothetical protein [Candidatus Latescibacterota bacterium]